MSKRNTKAVKAARRKAAREKDRAIRERPGVVQGWDEPVCVGELPVEGARGGCPHVPQVMVPIGEMMQRPGAVRLPDSDLPAGVTAAVRWLCEDGCGQVHVSVWGDLP